MLVWRVLYELLMLGTPASRVIVTTFTKRAATELSVRIVERSDALLDQARKRKLELKILRDDLHCNAVRFQGRDITRLMTAAAGALKLGLQV